jgi:iduronate 2-sulfatase
MKKHITIPTGLLCLVSTFFVCGETTAANGEKPLNVMFIIVDDLRAELGSYGCGQMKTPNFDRLARSSMQFNRAYVQQAICCASRAGFLTGCRPDSTGVDHPYTPWFNSVFRKKYKPIAEYFADLGYYSRTLGKVHHGPRDPSLTEPHFAEKAPDYLLPENVHGADGWGKVYDRLLPWEHADLPDNAFRDGQIARETIATVRRAHASGKPFFIAPGFQKPHLPFVCPRKYYDLYSDKDVRRSPNPERGPGQPLFTIPKEINGIEIFGDFPKTGLADKDVVHGLRSYYACVSFIDAQVGKILDELDRLKLTDSTVVVVLSDHGFHLGDHGNWGKATCFERATRSPLFVRMPGMKTAGSQCDAFVEYVDLFPTVLDLCGAEVPQYMEGTSFAPLLKSPSTVWKKAVFSQFPRRADIDGRKKNIEGYSVRTKYFRFTQWRARETSNVVFEEFYDNRKNDIEDKNHAANPKFKAHVDQHRHLLRNGWKRALPPGVENSSNLPKGNDAWYFHPTKRQPTKKSKNP